MSWGAQKNATTNLGTAESPPWAGEEPVIESEGFGRDEDSVEASLTQPMKQNKSVDRPLRQELSRGQKLAWVLSHFLSIVILVLVIILINDSDMGGGGLSWKEGESKKVFNWHPLMMISAFILMTIASLAFRNPYLCTANRFYKKVYHAVLWTMAAICMSVGIVAVVKSHNDGESGYIANLYSLHSWVGVGVLSLYAFQFLGGVNYFVLKCGTERGRRGYLKLHQFYGPFIYYATAATILLGIQEKNGFMSCGYKVTSVDSRPWEHFDLLSSACQTSNFLGIGVFALSLTTGYALYTFQESFDED